MLSPLPEVHVLELAKDGYIRPHIDSVKVATQKFILSLFFLLSVLTITSSSVLRGGDSRGESPLPQRDEAGAQAGPGGGGRGERGGGGGGSVDLCPPAATLPLHTAVRVRLTYILRPHH